MTTSSDILDKADNKCPYCGFVFNPIPQRKKKCPSCGQFVYVRRRPNSNKKELVTTEVAKLIDKEWEEIDKERAFRSLLQRFNASELEYKTIERELTKKFSSIPKQGDVVWTLLNNRLFDAMKRKDWSQMEVLYFEQALLLNDEGKDCFASLRESKRCSLRSFQSQGVVHKVQISAAGDSSCDKCKALNGKVLTIEQALEDMPIPVRDCDNAYKYCRCLYLPVIE